MKCRNCSCAKRGYFASVPDAYVCTGVKEPFVIKNYPDAECTEYIKSTINDGVYIELFAVKNGVRYNAKIVDMKEVSAVLVNSLMDGIGKIVAIEEELPC